MAAYYNENNRYAARWLVNLIDKGLIASGDVDDRSIEDVTAQDLKGYTQCHFFAGIGGWSAALKIAGWPDERPVWTGSCPCQPFSVASFRGKGIKDKRHLWPTWFRLIQQLHPTVVFGEQVANVYGYQWLGGVHSQMDEEGFEFGAANLCAAGIGAKHKRQRLWFVAHSRSAGLQRLVKEGGGVRPKPRRAPAQHSDNGLSAGIFNSPNASSTMSIDGVPSPVDFVRAMGNAIVPQVGATFIRAFMECFE